jgi:hypothetical protein
VLRLPLDSDERTKYLADYGAFREVHAAFTRENPGASWEEFAAVAHASPEGRAAMAAWRRARSMLGLTRAKRTLIDELLARHRDSRVLVFTGDNEAAYAIARQHLVMPITCDITRAEREHALDAFRSRRLRTLVSSRVLNEGIDVPDADVAILVGGTSGERGDAAARRPAATSAPGRGHWFTSSSRSGPQRRKKPHSGGALLSGALLSPALTRWAAKSCRAFDRARSRLGRALLDEHEAHVGRRKLELDRRLAAGRRAGAIEAALGQTRLEQRSRTAPTRPSRPKKRAR